MLVAEIAPQHILQNVVTSQVCTGQDSSVFQNHSLVPAPSPHTGVLDHLHIDGNINQYYGHPSDIALRLSSKLKDPHRGFVFGRLQSRCDILMACKAETLISGVHFRVFVNEEGLTMLEHISRYGARVDEHFLEASSEDSVVRSTHDQWRVFDRGAL